MNSRFERILAVFYLLSLSLIISGMALIALGLGWGGALVGAGGAGIIVTAFDLALHDPTMEARERREYPRLLWSQPPGWRAAWNQVLLGKQIPPAWRAVLCRSTDHSHPSQTP